CFSYIISPHIYTLFPYTTLFRSGLISAHTVPSGGTSDYGPEMIHAAAKGELYQCFVRADATLPFMIMPDGIQALIKLAEAPRERSEEHTSELQSRENLVCRLLLE